MQKFAGFEVLVAVKFKVLKFEYSAVFQKSSFHFEKYLCWTGIED